MRCAQCTQYFLFFKDWDPNSPCDPANSRISIDSSLEFSGTRIYVGICRIRWPIILLWHFLLTRSCIMLKISEGKDNVVLSNMKTLANPDEVGVTIHKN